MRTAAYKVDVASDRRRRGNVPRHILFFVVRYQVLQVARHLNCRCQILQAASFQNYLSIFFLYPINLQFFYRSYSKI